MDTKPVVRRYSHDIEIADIPGLTVDGVDYVPFKGSRIDPELARYRKDLGTWPQNMCEPGYWVTYEPATSSAISALGSLWHVGAQEAKLKSS